MSLKAAHGREEFSEEHLAVLRGKGNGVPLALACVLQDVPRIAGLFKDPSACAVRVYRTVATVCGVRLEPQLDIELSVGQWLVHSEHDGLPHCTGLVVHADGETSTLYEGGKSVKLQTSAVADMVVQAADKKTMVMFQVFTTGMAQVPKFEALLDMEAGAEGSTFD